MQEDDARAQWLDALIGCCETDWQRHVISVLAAHGMCVRAAARELDRRPNSVREVRDRVFARAAKAGIAPEQGLNTPQPPGFGVRGVSTLIDKRTGETVLQWVKSTREAERAETYREIIEGVLEGLSARTPKTKPPSVCNEDILAVYPLGDPHFGMLAMADECGDNFDLKIAEQITVAAIDRLLGSTPPASEALFVSLGDLLHVNDSRAVTPMNENRLDVDMRFQRVYTTARRVMGHCIRRIMEKHRNVHVWMMPGNHDPDISMALADGLSAMFEGTERVHVRQSPSWFAYHRFGRVLIGATHGDKAKPQDLHKVMAVDRAEDWGATRFRYWYCGHVHHKSVIEDGGVVVETFRTLAAKDAWHAAQGYRSGRDMQCIVHHKDYGEVERRRCDLATILSDIRNPKITGV